MEIVKKAVELSQDQFGNYVVQHVIEHGKDVHKSSVARILKENLLLLSKQKFSSNVIERCLQHASEKDKELLISAMLGKETDP